MSTTIPMGGTTATDCGEEGPTTETKHRQREVLVIGDHENLDVRLDRDIDVQIAVTEIALANIYPRYRAFMMLLLAVLIKTRSQTGLGKTTYYKAPTIEEIVEVTAYSNPGQIRGLIKDLCGIGYLQVWRNRDGELRVTLYPLGDGPQVWYFVLGQDGRR